MWLVVAVSQVGENLRESAAGADKEQLMKYLEFYKRSNAYRVAMLVSCLFVSSGTLTAVQAQAEVDPEWPCIQVLVPEVALAVHWPMPLDESVQGTWRDDRDIRSLAEQLGDIDTFGDPEQKLIDDFAARTDLADNPQALNQLAEGVVSVANRVRSQFIRGIKRYTRQQITIAAQIEETLNLLSVENDLDDAAKSELTETLHWHQRVYDQREHAMTALCERPVELEEKLSSVLRHLSMYIP